MNVVRNLAWVVVLFSGCSSKKDLPADAYRNDAFAFGLVPPAGWKQVTPETAESFLLRYGTRLLPATHEVFKTPVRGKTSFVVAWVNTNAVEPLLPVIGVSHNSVGLVTVGHDEVRKSHAALQRNLAQSGYTDVQLGSGEITVVDGYQTIEMKYTATADRFKLRAVEDMVTSASRTHFVTLHADQQNFEANSKIYAQVVSTFRRFVGK